ncbi:MAG: thioredoxin family protein, partial [Lentisphaeria bacterium]|nr:thioredoxin family protein [Lentisphaeria bacterium]
MKQFAVFFLFLFLLIPLRSAEEQKGTWSVTGGKDAVTVTLTVNAPYQGMAEMISVRTEPELKATARPVEKDGYLMPDPHQWVFTGQPSSFPLTITADAQYCDSNGVCFMPEGTKSLGSFRTEDDWKNGIFTPADGVSYSPALQTESTAVTAVPSYRITGRTVGYMNPEEMVAFLKEEPESTVQTAVPSYRITGRAVGYMNPEEMVAFLKGEPEKSMFDLDGKGIFLTLLLVLLGGLALNLTPCVLPLIPVNLAIIGAGMNSDRSKADRLLRGLVYGLGITVAYGLLGVIAVLTGASFGGLAGNWLFNGIAALIFAFLALAMFGFFNFDLSRFGASIQLSGAKYAGIFLLGAVSATLAGACVAPVLAAVLIRSATLYAEGNHAGLLLPFLLGLGMALPWPFAAAGMALFPKPGAWMIRVKQILGVLILLLAVYYGVLAYGLAVERFRSGPETEQLAGDSPAVQEIGAALEQAKRENKLVLLDFWATWCKNCTALEHNTFPDPEVQKILKAGYILVRVQAEDAGDPATKALLEQYQVTGLPTLLILTP